MKKSELQNLVSSIVEESIKHKGLKGIYSDFKNFESLVSGDIIVCDTETTGLSPKSAQITEIAAVKIKDGKISKTLHEKIKLTQETLDIIEQEKEKPSKFPISKILEMTGYYSLDLPEIDEKDAIKRFSDFCDGSTIVAHNASYDMKMVGSRGKFKINGKVIDSLAISRIYFNPLVRTLAEKGNEIAQEMVPILSKEDGKPRNDLGALAKVFNINNDNWHSAIADVMNTAKILVAMIKFIKENEDILLDENFMNKRDSELKSHAILNRTNANNYRSKKNIELLKKAEAKGVPIYFSYQIGDKPYNVTIDKIVKSFFTSKNGFTIIAINRGIEKTYIADKIVKVDRF